MSKDENSFSINVIGKPRMAVAVAMLMSTCNSFLVNKMENEERWTLTVAEKDAELLKRIGTLSEPVHAGD